MEELISPKEAAKMLKVTTNSLRNWELSGQLKCVKTLGGEKHQGHRRYRLDDIKKLLEQKL